MICYLAEYGVSVNERPLPPCEGRLVKVHLIPQSFLRREYRSKDVRALCMDPRGYVWGCGGIVGNGGCHGRLDHSRTLKLPREALPLGLEEFAAELGPRALAYLDREYGERA